MDNSLKEQLASAGIDVDEALARFMNNEALLLKYLKRFATDGNRAALQAALQAGDAPAAYAAAHTLKGVTGNLSMRRLYAATCEVVEPLRAGDVAGAAANMAALDAAYRAVIDALARL